MAIEAPKAIDQKTINKEHKNGTNDPPKPKKPKRRDKSDLGDNFVAPDGGWGWVVCFAAGFSNFSMFPSLQQYGLIYRERMTNLGFDAKQTTTIVNIVMALSSVVGIVNGAMFRRFTFRQVAIVGSLLVFIGIFASAFCTTFTEFAVFFSCIYGIGLGLGMSSTSLAVNTYFKIRRRRATGFAWTITGLGPIIFPHITTFLIIFYGVQGTILIYAGIALNALLCAVTLQPVLWHVKPPPNKKVENEGIDDALSELNTTVSDYLCKYCEYMRRSKRNLLSSQFVFNDDDTEMPGYEITEPGTPMLARANDGWYGSQRSLASAKGTIVRRHQLMRKTSLRSQKSIPEVEKEDQDDQGNENPLYKPNYFNREREAYDRYASKNSVYSKPGVEEFHCTCVEDKAVMQKITDEELKIEEEKIIAEQEAEETEKKQMTFLKKVVKFFDLDLLKDFTFVNLAIGMSVMMFGEMNFSVLTPFILNSYGYTDGQISLAMSLLGGMDISIRFLAPFALEKVKLDNRVLFAFGIIAISVGRFIVTLTDSYQVTLAVFVLIGFGKAFRTIFSPLIIPSYVPLKRLPGASGLQLVFNTLFSITFGPILGVITDATSYTVTIHFINSLTMMALLFWLAESIVRRVLGKKMKPIE